MSPSYILFLVNPTSAFLNLNRRHFDMKGKCDFHTPDVDILNYGGYIWILHNFNLVLYLLCFGNHHITNINRDLEKITHVSSLWKYAYFTLKM